VTAASFLFVVTSVAPYHVGSGGDTGIFRFTGQAQFFVARLL
jgi:hypothetical protein